MKRRILLSWGVAMLLCVAAYAQMPNQYLDVNIARVKPDKRAEFDAVCKKMVEANRKNHGDTWVAMETCGSPKSQSATKPGAIHLRLSLKRKPEFY